MLSLIYPEATLPLGQTGLGDLAPEVKRELWRGLFLATLAVGTAAAAGAGVAAYAASKRAHGRTAAYAALGAGGLTSATMLLLGWRGIRKVEASFAEPPR